MRQADQRLQRGGRRQVDEEIFRPWRGTQVLFAQEPDLGGQATFAPVVRGGDPNGREAGRPGTIGAVSRKWPCRTPRRERRRRRRGTNPRSAADAAPRSHAAKPIHCAAVSSASMSSLDQRRCVWTRRTCSRHHWRTLLVIARSREAPVDATAPTSRTACPRPSRAPSRSCCRGRGAGTSAPIGPRACWRCACRWPAASGNPDCAQCRTEKVSWRSAARWALATGRSACAELSDVVCISLQ
jgi:hypothetical protein